MKNNPKVLMIGMDRKLFEDESPVSVRIKELYAPQTDELHIVVFSLKKLGFKKTKIGSNVWVYPTNSLSRWLYPLDAVRMGKRLVKEKGFVRGQSLITTQDPFECGWVGLRVKLKWRLPLEVQLHTDPFSPQFSGFLNWIRQRLAKKVLPQADSLRVVSENLKLNIENSLKIENWKLKINTLPIYIDKERIEQKTVTFDLHARFGWQFILLTVSRLTGEKNIPLALDALALLRQRFPSIGLVIVGSGPEENSLKLKVTSLKLEQNVAFEGWKEDLASYYKTANAYIQTSRFEGYGMSLVEAGLSGLPVVTTPVGIANDLEDGKEAYICPQGDAGYFANAIADLVENNQHRENLKLNMKNFLDRTLLSKEEYLNQLQKNWQETANKTHIKHL